MSRNHEVVVLPSAVRTVSGASGDIAQTEATRGMFFLNVTAASGTSPTLDVTVEAKDPVSGEYFTIGTFAQATGVSSEMVAIGGGSDAEFVPRTFRVAYAMAGTSPSFTFSVGAALDGAP